MVEHLVQEAENFIRISYEELGKSLVETQQRIDEIKQHIRKYGYYEHTYEELAHGAKMAWRNSNRCIGRLFWNQLQVFDARNLDHEEDIFHALEQHLEYATNKGTIRPTITIFKPKLNDHEHVRIWNHQLIRYAGYETGNGIVGDSSSVSLTKACLNMGWKGKGTHFDILPLVIQINGNDPRWFAIPKDLVLEVPITHPQYNLFKEDEVKWYAVPIISDMRLEIGGIHYVAAPFNGWYMGTEIGARNLSDSDRYNLLPQVAESLGLDTNTNTSLWKDRALVELNIAVLDSFKRKGVSIVDHHTAAQQFKMFEKNEEKEGRELTGQWSWLIPPLSPATAHIFHKDYTDKVIKPNYFYQDAPYEMIK